MVDWRLFVSPRGCRILLVLPAYFFGRLIFHRPIIVRAGLQRLRFARSKIIFSRVVAGIKVMLNSGVSYINSPYFNLSSNGISGP